MPPASPPAAQATTPALDAGAIVALSDDLGEDGARKALRTFVKHTTEQLNAMPGLLADGARLRVEVHSIKGAARLVGATRLASDAAALERRIVEGGSVQDADIAQLREAFDDFQAAMRRDPRLAELARTAA